MHNAAMLDIGNNGTDTIIFKSEEMLGILNLRSLGYYKIKQDILQQNLSKYYKFERADTLCKCFNRFIMLCKVVGCFMLIFHVYVFVPFILCYTSYLFFI